MAARWIERVFTPDVFEQTPVQQEPIEEYPPLPTQWTTNRHGECDDVAGMWGAFWADLLVDDLQAFIIEEKAKLYDAHHSRRKKKTRPPGKFAEAAEQGTPKSRTWEEKSLPAKYMEAFERVQEKHRRLLDALDTLLKSKRINALHVMGSAGTGKSHFIKDYLQRYYKQPANTKGGKWRYKRGGLSTGGLYEYCRRATDKTLVFDDVLSLFRDKSNQKHLLVLFEPGTEREMSHERQVLPSKKNPKKTMHRSHYTFTGKIITIANVSFGEDEVAKAIGSRPRRRKLDFTPDEMEAFLADIACKGVEELSPDECLGVLSRIIPVFAEENARLSVRWYVDHALDYYRLTKQGVGTRTEWIERLREEIRNEKEDANEKAPILTTPQKKKIMEDIVVESYEKFPARNQLQARLKMWTEETKARLKETRQKGMYHETVKKLKAEGRLNL